MALDSYRKLIVWQKSFELAKDSYSLTDRLPSHEQFGLTSQTRRNAVSIPSNITEGQQRNNIKEYCQFLGIARGSAAELHTQLQLVEEIYNLDTIVLRESVENIQKMLYTLLKRLQTN